MKPMEDIAVNPNLKKVLEGEKLAEVRDFREMTADQRRILIDSVQVYEAYENALEKTAAYKGGMH